MFVLVAGLSVVAGWVFDIGILKSVLPNHVEMKFVTALSFIAAGIILYSVAEERQESSFVVQTILPAAILTILILMATLFVASVFGIGTSIDSSFIKEPAGAVHTVIPGRPTMPTMFSFILIAIAGILFSFGFRKQLFPLGVSVAIIGGIAVVGYIINRPLMYYFIAGKTTAIAFNTAILFVVIGIGFILCGKIASKQN